MEMLIDPFTYLSLQVQIDNDKCRRASREVRLSGSRIDLASLCSNNSSSATTTTTSNHGTQSSNNINNNNHCHSSSSSNRTSSSSAVTVNGNSRSAAAGAATATNMVNGRRPTLDALGNSLPPLSPQSNINNNNMSPSSMTDKSSSSFNVPMTPSGELSEKDVPPERERK